MIILIAIIYFGYQLIKETNEDIEMRQWAINKGYDSYPSNTGLRDVRTNKPYVSKQQNGLTAHTFTTTTGEKMTFYK